MDSPTVGRHMVGDLVIGYNKGWKDSINLGNRNNQTFVCIPYARLRKVVGDSEFVTRITDSGRLFRPLRLDVL